MLSLWSEKVREIHSICKCTIWSFPLNSALTSCIFYMMQVSDSAKKDLKEGMKLYNSENNVGLKNAWNIIQAEVTFSQ